MEKITKNDFIFCIICLLFILFYYSTIAENFEKMATHKAKTSKFYELIADELNKANATGQLQIYCESSLFVPGSAEHIILIKEVAKNTRVFNIASVNYYAPNAHRIMSVFNTLYNHQCRLSWCVVVASSLYKAQILMDEKDVALLERSAKASKAVIEAFEAFYELCLPYRI